MMSEGAAKYYELYKATVGLAAEMEAQFPGHRGWNCVVRFYAALHLIRRAAKEKIPIVDLTLRVRVVSSRGA